MYDKILDLRIANAQIIVNYAAFLEENKYYEESFKVYERGTELFTFPVSFEIWNIYLSKFVKRYVRIRRFLGCLGTFVDLISYRVVQNWSVRVTCLSRPWSSVLLSSASRFT